MVVDIMETIKVHNKLTLEEKETTLSYDNIDKIWIMDTTVSKHYNKALKQGWIPIRQYIYDDGTVCGMVLTAPEWSVTIRTTTKREMTEKQLTNLSGKDKTIQND